MNKLLSTSEAATRLGLSPRRVRQFCQEGRLGTPVAGRRVIAQDELEEFARKPRPEGYPRGKSRTQ